MQSPAPYELQSPLGTGAMGEVWKAWDAHLCRPVAIKFLSSSLAREAAAQERFRREVLAASALNHPHILTVYACGESEGRPFLVSEFIEGEDLRAVVNRGPCDLAQVLEWSRQALAGLEAAHAAGILHRDLKPENFVIRSDGYLKIVDFGLAKLLHARDTGHLTGEKVVGTLAYMAPEQLQGHPLDARADLFALASVVCELVTGKPAHPGQDMTDTITAILTGPPRLPDGPLQGWLARALQKSPADRFANARQMREALPLASGSAPVPHVLPPILTELVLVLPFTGSESELAEGVSDALIDRLGRIPGLKVVSSLTARQYAGQDPREAARQVHASWVLTGQLRRSSNRVRLGAALTRADQDFQDWSQRIDAELKDLFELEDELTERLLDSLRQTKLLGRAPAPPPSLPSEVLARYHEGLQELAQLRVSAAIPRLEEVVRAEAGFAPALARLAQCRFLQALASPANRETYLEEGLALAQRALDLEAENPDALVALAMLSSSALRRDLPEARRLLRRALQAHPGHADALSRLAYVTWMLGNVVAAEMLARRAIQLDPLLPFPYIWLSLALTSQGRLLDAADSAERGLRAVPDSPPIWLTLLLSDLARGEQEQARRFLAHLQAAHHETPVLRGASLIMAALDGQPLDPTLRPWERDQRNALELKMMMARALACTGQHADRCLTLLEEAAREGFRNYAHWASDPLLANVHDEPRFAEVLKTMRQACQEDPEFREPLVGV